MKVIDTPKKLLIDTPKKVLRYIYQLLRDTFQEYSRDKAIRYGAAISFYTLFSLPALSIIVIRIAGVVVGQESVKEEVLGIIAENLTQDTADQVNLMIDNLAQDTNSFWATLLSLGTLIFAASGVFYSLRDALNAVWKIRPHIRKGSFLKTIFDRVLSFTMVFTLGFILLVSMILHTIIRALETLIVNFSEKFRAFLTDVSPEVGAYADQLDVVLYVAFAMETFIGLLIVTLTFSLIFKFLADAYPSWRDVFVGALFTAILFNIGKVGIGWYISHSSVLSGYGAAGSIVLLLLWVYYSSQIFLLGAEFVWVYTRRHGRKIEPSDLAISLIDRPIHRLRQRVLRLMGRSTKELDEDLKKKKNLAASDETMEEEQKVSS
ncbi:MAG: YihY/virulence factor BrkB family protein [Bacteroidota bacterium]